MKTWTSFLIRFGGLAFFGLSLFGVLLFAEGYQYDSVRRSLVKKGIVYFEGRPPQALLRVDGAQQQWSLGGEVRTIPGLHQFSIEKAGSIVWRKQILVPDQSVVRYPRITLVPSRLSAQRTMELAGWQTTDIDDSHIVSLNPALHAVRYFDVQTAELSMHELPRDVQLVSLKAINQDLFIGRDRRGRLHAIDFRAGTVLTSALFAKDFVIGKNEVFYIDEEGRVRRANFSLAGSSPFISLPYPVNSITGWETDRDLYGFAFDGTSAVVSNESGAILFIQEAQSFTLGEGRILYTENARVREYDFKTKITVERGGLPETARMIRAIPDSFHMLVLGSSGSLSWCDRDGENCASLAAGVARMSYDEASDVLFFENQKNLIRLELPAPNLLPEVLTDFVS